MYKSKISFLDLLSMKNDNIRNLYDRKKIGNNYLKLDKNTPRDKISILNDSMFKAMMYHENRLKYSCKLLSYYLNIPYEELLKTLKLGKNEFDKRNERNKGERGDYVAYYKNLCFNIEVNCNDSIETMERNREYRHRLQAKKVKIGDNYVYTPVLQLNINDFAFEGKEKTKSIFYLMDEDGDVESDNEIVINIYVPNIYKKWNNKGLKALTEDERFLLTLIEPSIEKAKTLGKGDTIMEEFIKESIEVSKEDDLLEAYDKEWAIKDQSRRDGKREGLKEGRKEGQERIIKCLCKKYGVNTIMEMTGLSREEVEEYAGEDLREEDFLGEAYDKEWAIRDKSRRDGEEKGIIKGKKEIVKHMCSQKYGVNSIMEMTGLSREEIEEYVGENLREDDFLGETYDKEWAIKDQGRRKTEKIG